MREHESLGLRRQGDLGGLFRGRVPGVAGTLALFLAERCLVNQQIRFLCGIHGGSAGACVTGERDESAGPGSADEASSRQLSAVSKLDDLALGEFAPERAFWNSRGLGLLDVKPPAPYVLLQDVPE